MIKITLKIREVHLMGMYLRRIGTALKGVAGVTDANTDPKAGLAAVIYEGDVKEEGLVRAVVSIGLRAEVKCEWF